MSAQEIFWVINHGVKDTGMPAFGPTHDDRAMWSMTAFIKALPNLSAADYATLKESVEGHHHEGAEEEQEHGEVESSQAAEQDESAEGHADHDHAAGTS